MPYTDNQCGNPLVLGLHTLPEHAKEHDTSQEHINNGGFSAQKLELTRSH